MKLVTYIQSVEEFELYAISVLFLFTLWFIVNTILYYRAEKRRLKQLRHFNNRREVFSQTTIGKYYDKGHIVKRNYCNAVFWSKKVAFAGGNISFDKFWNRTHSRKRKRSRG